MTKNKKRNTQIPEELIEGPAGKNDNIKINVWAGFIYLKDINKDTTKSNSDTKTIESAKRPVLSSNLEEGMRIKAENTPRRTRQSESVEIDK